MGLEGRGVTAGSGARMTAVALAALAGGTFCRAAAVEGVRCFEIRPNALDYTFMSASRDARGQWVLAFNRRGTRTVFARVGETFDGFTVESYEHGIRRVFKETLNAFHEEPAGKVVLAGPDGRRLTLEQGKPLPEPGWMGYLVSMSSGSGWGVRAGDQIEVDGAPVRVLNVSPEAVTLSAGGTDWTPPTASAEERIALAARWEKLRAEREEQRRPPAPDDRGVEKWEAAVARNAERERAADPRYARGTRLTVGTEYRYPVDWEVIPPVYDRDGKMIRPPFVIPTRFETRTTGFTMTPNRFESTTVDSYAEYPNCPPLPVFKRVEVNR
jgi:hypothetical protein